MCARCVTIAQLDARAAARNRAETLTQQLAEVPTGTCVPRGTLAEQGQRSRGFGLPSASDPHQQKRDCAECQWVGRGQAGLGTSAAFVDCGRWSSCVAHTPSAWQGGGIIKLAQPAFILWEIDRIEYPLPSEKEKGPK